MGIICGEIADGGGYPAVRVNACGELMLVRGASTVAVSACAVAGQSGGFAGGDFGAALDTLNHSTVSYTIRNLSAANTMEWRVIAANDSAFSDLVVVNASAQLAACGTSNYSASPAPYRYYKVQAFITASGSACTANLNGVAKG